MLLRLPSTALTLNILCQYVLSTSRPSHNATLLAFRMLDSTIARGDGCSISSASTNFIELGIFQQTLRESIALTEDSNQKSRWSACLKSGLLAAASVLKNATADVGYPLDRLSIGTNMIHHLADSEDDKLVSAVQALQESVALQPLNANGGLWYYDNLDNLTAYRNLSYLDGMYSLAPFVTLSTLTSDANIQPVGDAAAAVNLEAVWDQLKILVGICEQPSGLLVHGYDAIKAHSWASSVTGASPIVWCRAQAWFTLGVLQSLEILQRRCLHWPGAMRSNLRVVFEEMKALFNSIILAQIQASEASLKQTGLYGVWQVVDHPGEAQNFVEASSTCMTIYSLLKGAELGLLSLGVIDHAEETANGMYNYVLKYFLIENSNDTLSFNGTSSVASLSGEVSYEYYVGRPTEINSLIGIGAFALASLQVGSNGG